MFVKLLTLNTVRCVINILYSERCYFTFMHVINTPPHFYPDGTILVSHDWLPSTRDHRIHNIQSQFVCVSACGAEIISSLQQIHL